jgi:hypothetical protein
MPDGQTPFDLERPMPSEWVTFIFAVLGVTWVAIGHIYWFVFVTDRRGRAMEIEAVVAKFDDRFAKMEKRFEEARKESTDERRDASRQRELLAREMGEVSAKINWMTTAIGEMGGSRYPHQTRR